MPYGGLEASELCNGPGLFLLVILSKCSIRFLTAGVKVEVD
jgi:hypothetical protein